MKTKTKTGGEQSPPKSDRTSAARARRRQAGLNNLAARIVMMALSPEEWVEIYKSVVPTRDPYPITWGKLGTVANNGKIKVTIERVNS